jgi:hypothetical protein
MIETGSREARLASGVSHLKTRSRPQQCAVTLDRERNDVEEAWSRERSRFQAFLRLTIYEKRRIAGLRASRMRCDRV